MKKRAQKKGELVSLSDLIPITWKKTNDVKILTVGEIIRKGRRFSELSKVFYSGIVQGENPIYFIEEECPHCGDSRGIIYEAGVGYGFACIGPKCVEILIKNEEKK